MEIHQTIEQQKLARATKRVKAVSGFYKHLIVYILVNIFLILSKYFQLDPGEKFLMFGTFATAFFWGIGLAFHAFGVFTNNVLFSNNWEEKKIREIMDKDKQQKWE